MDAIDKALSLFHGSIEVRANLGEQLAPQLAHASQLIVETFVNDSRVLLCGHANAANTAQHFATTLLNQGSRERPGLPAILLDTNAAVMSAIGHNYGPSEIFSRQVRALGQAGDLLIIYTAMGAPQSLINAVQAAHEREIRVLLFSGIDGGGHVAQLLDASDLQLPVQAGSELLVHELHLLMSFILSDLVDDHLFGENS